MTDHLTRENRLAPLRICQELPDWRVELLTASISVLAIVLIYVLSQLAEVAADRDAIAGEREFWRDRATAEDLRPTVRLTGDGGGFTCEHMNIRREWEVAVAAECKVMGELLRLARASY